MKPVRFLVLSTCLLVTLACLGQGAGVLSKQNFGNLYRTFYSIGSQDGWVLESAEGGDAGREMNRNSMGLRVGDDSAHHEYRSILSFDTSGLPDDAIITGASLVLKQESKIAGAGNPFIDFRGLLIDLKWGYFGAPGLGPDDFQALPDISSFGPYSPELAETYTFQMGRAAYPYINKWSVAGGLTQFRLRFELGDNGDGRDHYIDFSSGDALMEAWRPQLLIEYHLPSRNRLG